MNTTIFSGDVLVELQGEDALNLIRLEEKLAIYSVNGFEGKVIIIEDHRIPAVEGLKIYFNTGNVETFHSGFNAPANAIIEKDRDDNIKITLLPTKQQEPDYILWFALGIGEVIPAYDYIMTDSRAISPGRFALFALYHYPEKALPVSIPYSQFVQCEHI